MKPKSIFQLAGAALPLVLSVIASTNIYAQNYPDKPIRIVVAYPPGGGNDILARPMAQKLSESFGQPVFVDNRAGASGVIGSEYVAKAAPDGYTLIIANNGTHAIMPGFNPKLPYDPARDFAPITLVALTTHLVVVHPSVPAKSIGELIALAKASPNSLNYGSAGSGSIGHVSTEMLKIMANIKMVHVPYKGVGPAVVDLVAGQIQVMLSNAPPVVPFVKSGKLRALAVTSTKRLAAMPELPTVAEAGIPGYEANLWYGLLAPAGTPSVIVRKLHRAMVDLLSTPDIKKVLFDMGAEPIWNTPEEFASVIRADIVKWGKVIEESGARVE